ncbi:hypothetical protein [Enterococcus sp. LJL90]
MKRIYFNEHKAIVADEEDRLYQFVEISKAQMIYEQEKAVLKSVQALDLKEGFLIEMGYVKI